MTLTLICERCGEQFTPDDAADYTILGPGYARYSCPECCYVVRSLPPVPRARDELESAIVPIDDNDMESRQ